MKRCHVAVPRFLEEGFKIKDNKNAYCYDWKNDRAYTQGLSSLGVCNYEYSDEVEEELSKIEAKFNNDFMVNYLNANDDEKINVINKNIQLIEYFFNLMVQRAWFSLETVNKNLLTNIIFGNTSHDMLVTAQMIRNYNSLNFLIEEKFYYPVVIKNDSMKFINNSLGFGVHFGEYGLREIYIPLTEENIVMITNRKISDSSYIIINTKKQLDKINKDICSTEVQIGNGFIFGDKSHVDKLIDYAKKIKLKHNR